MFAPGPIMFPMGAVALGGICWPEVVLWSWFPVEVHFPQLIWLLAFWVTFAPFCVKN